MASTYVNDLRLNEMATGDGSGTWGTTTNTNLELIAEAFSYGTEAITTNADTHTTTIADGASDPGRALYLKYTGTLDSACTITIGPNTVSKVWIIENGTSGSQNIIISQGSGANITIPAGDTKVVYSDGAGAGAAFVDAFASLSVVDLKVQDDLTVTDDASIGGDATITGTLGVTGNITGTLATAAQPNITSVGTLTGFTSTGIDDNATSTAITIDSSENVGIGTSSPGTYQLAVDSGTSGTSNALAGIFVEGQRNGVVYNLVSNNTDNGTDKGSGIQFRSGGFLTSGIIGRSDTVAASGDAPGYLSFHTSTDGSEDFAERMRIDSSGNLLLNTTSSPTTTKAIISSDYSAAGTTNTGLTITGRQGGNWYNNGIHALGSSGLVFSTGTTGVNGADATNERMRIDSSGNVGIGTISPAAKLDVNGDYQGAGNIITSSGFIRSPDGSAGTPSIQPGVDGDTGFFRPTNNNIGFSTGGSEAMRIDSSGNLLVGKTSQVSAGRFGIQYDSGQHGAGIDQDFSGGGTFINFLVQNSSVGSIQTSGTATSFNTSSDYRLKEDDVPMTGATERVKALRPINFAWKVDGSRVDGFLAHEVQDIVPEAVTGEKDAVDDEGNPEYQGIDQSKLVPLLVKTIQELEARITALES